MSSNSINDADYGGKNPIQALHNIKKRREERRKGIKSKIKSALVLQGGGMRGVFGAGVCTALEELGYTEGFDEVYGVSAGALNEAYFLSGQAAYGTTIYYQNINNANFVNFFRLKKMVNIDFLIKVITKMKPLNIQKVLNSSTVFNIILTDISTGKSVLFSNRSPEIDLLKVLKATAAMPFAYDVPVDIKGVAYLDGGVSCPIPIEEAIRRECTDILVVTTRPKEYVPVRPRGIIHEFLVEPRMKKHSQNFYQTYMTKHKKLSDQLNIVMGKTIASERRVNIIAIFPAKSTKIKRTTISQTVLKKVAIEGATKTLTLFGANDYHPTEILRFLNKETFGKFDSSSPISGNDKLFYLGGKFAF